MRYQVYFIKKKFQKIMTKDLLIALLEKERTSFTEEQMRQIIENVLYGEFFEIAHRFFANRDDIAFANLAVATNSPFASISRLFVEKGELFLEKEEAYSPLLDFLYWFSRSFILVPIAV